jgi:hypothetical protein
MKILRLSKPSKGNQSRHKLCFNSGAMKKFIKKHITSFPVVTFGIALTATALLYAQLNSFSGTRNLSESKEYEISLSSIRLDSVSQIHNKDNVFLRLKFDENNVLDIGRGQNWNLKQGQQILVDQKIAIEPRFIQNDETKFTVELMHEQNVWNVSKADIAVLRCNTIAKELSAYNRSFQCFVPGEKTPVLTYRLAEKGVPVPNQGSNQVASF